jgi:hypothetical protein
MSKFKNFIYNPWVVTVGGGLLIIIILNLIDLVSGLNIIGFLSQEARMPLWIILVILLFGYLVGYSIYSIRNKKHALDINTMREILGGHNIDTSDKNVRIPSRFELTQLNNDLLEWTVFIKSKWKPNEHEPGIEEFLNSMELSKFRCHTCHSDLIEHGYRRKKCSNSECTNKKIFTDEELYRFQVELFGEFRGRVRAHYEDYWNNYKEIYSDYLSYKKRPPDFEFEE